MGADLDRTSACARTMLGIFEPECRVPGLRQSAAALLRQIAWAGLSGRVTAEALPRCFGGVRRAGSEHLTVQEPAYPLGPRFAGPRPGLAGGCAPSGPPERQRHVMSAGRAVWVKIRASEAERAEWHAKARSAGLTLSDLVRRSVGRVRTWTVPHADVERERTRELARIGNNLNQIARWANTHKGAVEAVEVIGHLIAIERALAALAPVEFPDRDAH